MSDAAMHYNRSFFDSISGVSARSARHLLPIVLDALEPKSVVDIGCGTGAWLAEFLRLGVSDATGVDGAYVAAETLLIPATAYRAQDIAQRFDLGRRYDLAVCLEVGEHIPKASSATLVANIVAHAPMVLFSAAVPGQGGQDHINEQPLEFWRDLFAQEGFVAFDAFRPLLRGARDVDPWYRNNVLLYVREDTVAGLPDVVRATAIPVGAAIADVSSPLFRLRKLVLRNLPRLVVTAMARAKHVLRSALKTVG
jgi:SAM-dependent methyltransferase